MEKINRLLPFHRTVKEEESASTMLHITFVNTVPKECLCTLCEKAMMKPCHLTCCSAAYCKMCAERMRTASLACRSCCSLSYNIDMDYQDEAMERLVLSLLVFCPLKVPGCMWKGKLEVMEDHLQWGEYNPNETVSCRYLPVPCPMNCDEHVPRRDMDEHAHMKCKYRMKQCICGKRDTEYNIDNVHARDCIMRIAECPNGCQMSGILYKDLPFHVEGQCPFRMVSCDYKNIGCDGWFYFNDRQKHNDSNINEHFWLMSEKVVTMDMANNELRSSCLYAQSVCKKLQEQYDVLLSLLDNKEGGETSTNVTGQTTINYREEAGMEAEWEYKSAENIDGMGAGYMSMGRQDTLKRYQTSDQIRNTWPAHRKNSNLSFEDSESKLITHADSHMMFESGDQAAKTSRSTKPVITGAVALSRLEKHSDLSYDTNQEAAGYGGQNSRSQSLSSNSSPPYWKSSETLTYFRNRQQRSSDQRYVGSASTGSDWGSCTSSPPITPTLISNSRGQIAPQSVGYAKSNEIKAQQHRKISKSLSVDACGSFNDSEGQSFGRVKKLAAILDTRRKSTATCLPIQENAGLYTSDNSFPVYKMNPDKQHTHMEQSSRIRSPPVECSPPALPVKDQIPPISNRDFRRPRSTLPSTSQPIQKNGSHYASDNSLNVASHTQRAENPLYNEFAMDLNKKLAHMLSQSK